MIVPKKDFEIIDQYFVVSEYKFLVGPHGSPQARAPTTSLKLKPFLKNQESIQAIYEIPMKIL